MNNYVSPWMDDGGTNEIMKESISRAL